MVGIVYPRAGDRVNAFDLPIPAEWAEVKRKAAPRMLVFPDDVLAIVWPD